MHTEEIAECLVKRHHWKKVTYIDFYRDYGSVEVWICSRMYGYVEFIFKRDDYGEKKEIVLCKEDIRGDLADWDAVAVAINEKALKIQKAIQTDL